MSDLSMQMSHWIKTHQLMNITVVQKRLGARHFHGRILEFNEAEMKLLFYHEDEKKVYNLSMNEIEDIAPSGNKAKATQTTKPTQASQGNPSPPSSEKPSTDKIQTAKPKGKESETNPKQTNLSSSALESIDDPENTKMISEIQNLAKKGNLTLLEEGLLELSYLNQTDLQAIVPLIKLLHLKSNK